MSGPTDSALTSQNFEFLRPRRPVLAELATFGERYAYSDPASSLVKQRGFIEQAVLAIYDAYRLRPLSDKIYELLEAEEFRQAVPEIIIQKFHTVRIAGNHAAHPRTPITSARSLDCLRLTFDIAQWFHILVDRGARTDCPTYSPPTAEPKNSGKTREAQERLRLAEAQYQALVTELEQERKRRAQAEQASQITEDELAQLKSKGQQVVGVLSFSEATTRSRLIDELLREVGWDVGANGVSTEQVGQEIPLVGMPTESGDGRADYVLYGDDGKPLAVIEAKKTAKDAAEGKTQAALYADCLENATGQRPAIFFTNGIDIFLWDDVQGYPYRKVYGFYSKDSLEYLHFQRRNRKPISHISPNLNIADRIYQIEAVKRVCERFSENARRALLVQATGTGKTRIAISLCDVLLRAGWVKRILFLCDRRELRKQADLTFKEYLPGEPRVIVDSDTSSDRTKRIYLSTYPAMAGCFEDFDVGFFDLIIADESHRSIYKKYRSLFLYFDALQIGLTATPVQYIERNTYKLFSCEDRLPTAHFSYTDALNSAPAYLVPFRVRTLRSQIHERGLKYAQLNETQQGQLEEQDNAPTLVDYDPEQIDSGFFNKDTTRFLWRTLMEEGIREATGSHVGKTIVFARGHTHAMHLAEVFRELYPQYGSDFCAVIDNSVKYADTLIDRFKSRDPQRKHPIFIAISVDMLDTGIDVPDVVNLVFAKPVKSFVKFWQMIGRGTRLCKNLLGPGKDKKEFLIFDNWSNFWFFDEEYKEKEPSAQRSLLQQLFETRVALADAALQAMNEPLFQATVALLIQDIKAVMDTRAIDVRDRYRELEKLVTGDRIAQFSVATKADLLSIAAPLLHWRNIRGDEDAYRFDLLVARSQLELLRQGPTGSAFLDLKARIEDEVELLLKNQSPVKAKAATIAKVRDREIWKRIAWTDLEDMRLELRGIMKHQQQSTTTRVAPQVFDIDDDDFVRADYTPKLEGLDLVEYKLRVESVLQTHFSANPTIQRIRQGQPVSDQELEALAKLVLQIDDRANILHLTGHDKQTRKSLLDVFRSLVGLDAEAVDRAFSEFVHTHPRLSAQQLRFLQLLQNHIAQHGGIELARVYEPPFTTLHSNSVDGLFPNEAAELISILRLFAPRSTEQTA